MMDVSIVLKTMSELFIMLLIGYVAAKAKFFDYNFGVTLSSFIVNLAITCLILASISTIPPYSHKGDAVSMLIIGIVFYLIMPFVAYFLTRILKIPQGKRKLFMYMTIWSNIGYMGYPVIRSIFGEGALFYASLFNMIFNLSNFSLGYLLMADKSFKDLSVKMMFSPGIIASFIAIFMFFFDLRFPGIFDHAFRSIGDTTTPLAMIVIGISLASIPLKDIFTNFKIYPFVLIKQVVLPIVSWLILKNFIFNQEILGLVVIIIAMPVAMSSVLFANKYDNDVETATKVTFLTTLASLLTIPAITYIIMM